MAKILLLALAAAVNPTMLAATTVMLMLQRPKRLLLAYLIGGIVTSVSIGLAIVFSLSDSPLFDTTRETVSPAIDLAVGFVALLVAGILATGRHERLVAQRRRRRSAKERDPWPQRLLGLGSARIAFIVGVALNLPGLYYVVALGTIHEQSYSTVTVALLIIAFNLMMFALAEIPLLGFALAPEKTRVLVRRLDAWIARNGRPIVVIAAAAIGTYLVVRGLAGWLT